MILTLTACAAHRQAWENMELLHRDISAGNILILHYTNKNGKKRAIGMLIDWDLCKYKKFLETVLRPARSVCRVECEFEDPMLTTSLRVRGSSCLPGS